MLPIMEDAGLAKRFAERTYSVQEVLLYSTVCGCGLGKWGRIDKRRGTL